MIALLEKSEFKGSYTNSLKQEVKVYTTTAYDEFIILQANREVVERTVKKIIASMNQRVEHDPILVNEKGEVIDGQHRLEAYRRTNTPLTFEMVKGLDVNTIRRLNTIQKEWRVTDHLHAGATEKDVSYMWMDNFCRIHKLQPSTALVLLKGNASNNPQYVNDIRAGEFACTREERLAAAERMVILEKLRVYSKATSKNFVTALVKVLEHPEIDINRLISSFLAKYKQTLAGIAGSYEQYIFQIQEMYNFRLAKNKQLKFISAAELERLNRKG